MNRKNKHLKSVRRVRTMLLTAVMTIASLMAVFASGTVTLPNGWVFDADFYAALKHTSGVHYPASDDDEGWELATIQVVDYNNGSVAVPLNCTASACTFTMPAFNIRIAVVFRDLCSTASEDIKTLRDLKAFTQDGVLYVSGIADGATLRVYNITGTLVYQGAAPADKAEIVLPARGVYILSDGKTVVKVNN